MNLLRRYPKFTKFTCLVTISGSAGWFCYQIKKTQDVLSTALDASVLSVVEPRRLKRAEENFVIVNFARNRDGQNWSLEKLWNSFKFSLAKRLIILANNENQFIRKRAVRQLAKVKNLEYWQFDLLSNMIDARTAVGLARTRNANPKLFTEPPVWYLSHTQNMIVDVMKDLLVNLHARSKHPCMGYFISRAFVDLHDVGRFGDHDTTPLELKKFMQSSHEVIPMCLESLLHHASLGNYAQDIVELNGLPLLMEIYNRFKDNIEVTATICRIISYMSMQQDLIDELFKYGWIGILAEWVQHQDVRISIPATKALANLDPEEDPIYLQRLYPLHPQSRAVRQEGADVVFIHGLLGGVFYTWRQRDKKQDHLGLIGKKKGRKLESIFPDTSVTIPAPQTDQKKPKRSDPQFQEFLDDLEEHLQQECLCKDYEMVWEDIPTNTNLEACAHFSCSYQDNSSAFQECPCSTNCWPRDWLASDCDHLRIIGVDYESNLSMWTPICPIEKIKTLEDISDELIDQFKKVGIGTRPIVWVTHSMGGLMVKNILCKAFESDVKELKQICLNTKGIVFYSTPHLGSSLAKLNQASALVIWPTTTVQELQQNSPKLLQIHEKFLNVTKHVPMKVVTFIETKATVVTAMKFQFLIVEPNSGNPGIGEYYEIPLDHLGICKPASRQSFLYQKVLHLIQEVIQDTRTGIKST